MELPLVAGPVSLRAFAESDLDALVAEANDRAVWRNMLDIFPHPYERSDGEEWITRCLAQDPVTDLVIDDAGTLIGVCGVNLGKGVSRHTASVGYWLGTNHWGSGIGTAVCQALLRYTWETFDVERIEAEVFAWNPASVRVLEKNGLVREGTRRKAIFKDGQFVDEFFYSILRSESA